MRSRVRASARTCRTKCEGRVKTSRRPFRLRVKVGVEVGAETRGGVEPFRLLICFQSDLPSPLLPPFLLPPLSLSLLTISSSLTPLAPW